MWDKAEEFLLKDKYIGPLVKKVGSCSIKKSPKTHYFKILVESIANQQLSGKAASTIFARFEKLCHGKVVPKVILDLSDEELRGTGFSFPKVKYIKDLAYKVDTGELNLKKLDNLSDEEVIAELTKVKGIGRWTAEMFLMFSLARPDVFPVDDLGIKKGFEKVTGRKFDKEKSFRFAHKNWSPFKTVASWYLWRSLEDK